MQLQTYNLLYQNTVITYEILRTMPNEFISKDFLYSLVIIAHDIWKLKGYDTNLLENNDKNDLNYSIKFANINKQGILSGCIYIDVNKSGQNMYFKLIPAISNFSNEYAITNHDNNTSPFIMTIKIMIIQLLDQSKYLSIYGNSRSYHIILNYLLTFYRYIFTI